MRGDHADLVEALDWIDPAELGYDEWLAVGMGLHESGLPMEAWESWSRRDMKRFNDGECARKWAGFGSGDGRVTGATVAKMARDRGWSPGSADRGFALAWDGEVDLSRCVVDPSWVEPAEIEAGEWDEAADLRRYLEALFDPEDTVGYCVESARREGRYVPANSGVYTRTAGEILDALARTGDVRAALGDYDERAGAWFRLNPLDGQGVKNANVAEFRYALVESDSIPKEMQLSLIRALELPCAAVVDSGNKSLHAVVRVDAADIHEYRARVDRLYAVCRKNGLEPDAQNKNPSRLTRAAGAMRGGSPQRLVSGPCGKASWREWEDWVEETTDDLPDPDNLAAAWDDMPDLAPPLIEGVLRQGHKMLVAGPSKAGKSFALIELCIALAEGGRWLGWKCAQGRVLYVNLELDPASCLHRFRDVYEALGIPPENIGNIDVWNLRGRSVPMDKLTPSLIRRALKTRPIAVVIDPIYKVITGDENAADEMSAFCNQFDRVAQQVGCAVIYCHHHSKGYQGQKRSMDRASGSGVFARDPDALLDMMELDAGPELESRSEQRELTRYMFDWMDANGPSGWRERVPSDKLSAGGDALLPHLRGYAESRGMGASFLDGASEARVNAMRTGTAWRIEGTLREFPGFDPVDVFFDYPLHEPDATGALASCAPVGEPQMKKQEEGGRSEALKFGALSAAVALCEADRVDATQENIYERALPYLSAFLKRPPKMESIFGGKNSWLIKKGCPIECVKPGVGRNNKAIYGMRRTPKEKDGK